MNFMKTHPYIIVIPKPTNTIINSLKRNKNMNNGIKLDKLLTRSYAISIIQDINQSLKTLQTHR